MDFYFFQDLDHIHNEFTDFCSGIFSLITESESWNVSGWKRP